MSFGPDMEALPLGPLNVIIGPNGSGKSNLIEAISLLQAAPSDFAHAIRKGGGIHDWLWKGTENPDAGIEVVTSNPPTGQNDLRYQIAFSTVGQRFQIIDEKLEENNEDERFYFMYIGSKPFVFDGHWHSKVLNRDDIDPEQSILSQLKDSTNYPVLTWIGRQFKEIRIFSDWSFGRKSILRSPCGADEKNDFLLEDCKNLSLILNSIKKEPGVRKRILGLLAEFYEGVTNFDVTVEGNSVQLFLEEGDYIIPATRLSDGTLRYLCLLAILCHPNPPPLICIEEPELGIHTDIIPIIANLLKEASLRTQLIVTTHSEALIDELSDNPETVLVCEKHEGHTYLKRLDSESLKDWLEKYSLGQLWSKGEIGGNRW